MTLKTEELRVWIASHMTTEISDELDRWKEKAATLVSLSPTGTVLPKFEVGQLATSDRILLQLLGKAYASAGGIVESPTMSNAQLKRAVPSPSGTIDRALLELRNEHLVDSPVRGENQLVPSRVGDAISRLSGKLGR